MTVRFSNGIVGLQIPHIVGAGGLLLCLIGQAASAADVLVVTDSAHPVRAAPSARVIELDLPASIEAELSAGLPADPGQAAALMQQRLRDGGPALQRRLGSAYQGVADAWGLGLVKLPAVVVDHRYVVYGEPDVAQALARIDAYRKAQP
ncbi:MULTISPECIES: TIGR03757 family integrating conjugative element protein [Burkholderiaceae]|uniref:TIGR03757 family integrating conjugative element protein n=1 Tax=Burkholderia cepacia TaxID=292 RepID=A0A8I1AQR6_BURCE|nr:MULTISPECIES: TIGR03757 family integrating conjugative element protein [Burkholderiaceae]MBB0025232.1 TIGR03757 family integrating conjugative element protein [Ralstonia pickettii]MBB0036020.1 TIGR03757 family integrating conjugative element protein [Ralstonia pickettii]MBB0098560.1 TIGR03757 family integrating conjugative element protein [Ralstonia pickettii]MBB0108381.1 TIGR03757 family integrating conjugative element protein [Ralstonia pickettii]MBB0129334.1 TIGR03757 family integrating 